MSLRDGLSHMHVVPAIVPVAAAATGNDEMLSAAIDTLGYKSASFVIMTGTLEDANATFTTELRECDTSNGTFTAVAAADIAGHSKSSDAEVLASFAYGDDSECRKIGYLGNKRYLKLSITPAGNSGNAPIVAVAILEGGALQPAANPPA